MKVLSTVKGINLSNELLSVNGYDLDFKALKGYVLSCIDNEDYNGNELRSNESKLRFVFNCFSSEFVYEQNVRRFKGDYTLMFADYLQGLRSCISTVFYYSDIINLFKSIEVNNFFDDITEEAQDDILNKFFEVISVVFMYLLNEKEIF